MKNQLWRLLITLAVCLLLGSSGALAAHWHGGEGGWHEGGGGWHGGERWHGGGGWNGGGEWNGGGGSSIFFGISPGYYYYNTYSYPSYSYPDYQCSWTSGYYDDFGNWVSAQRVCYSY